VRDIVIVIRVIVQHPKEVNQGIRGREKLMSDKVMGLTQKNGSLKELDSCLVVASGGQDSTFCIAWAQNQFKGVECISFNYGQSHLVELDCISRTTKKLGLEHKIFDVDILKINPNALTHHEQDIHKTSSGVPSSFVPYRNVHFLLNACTYARSKNIRDIVTGVCQTDFSGYKDCRDVFVKAFNVMIDLADDYNIKLHTPLMWMSKRDMVLKMKEMKSMDLWEDTNTCYRPIMFDDKVVPCSYPGTSLFKQTLDKGCPACQLRNKGFYEAGEVDPLYKKWQMEKKDNGKTK